MSDLTATLGKYTALSRSALLATASRSTVTALAHLKRVKEGSEKELLSTIVATALGADGKLSREEADFMRELFPSLTDEKLSALTARFENEKMRASIDRMIDGTVQLIINSPSSKRPTRDEVSIRAGAIRYSIPLVTTIRAANAYTQAISYMKEHGSQFDVTSLQEYYG